MADHMQLRLMGVPELRAYLKELQADLAVKRMRSALRKGGEVVRALAMARAPMGETGRLKEAVKVKAAPIKNRDYVVMHVGVSSGRGATPDAFYAKWIEFGKSKKHKQKPFPFLRSSLDESGPRVEGIITDYLRRSMRRYRGRRLRGLG